jgi:hypothetical protein
MVWVNTDGIVEEKTKRDDKLRGKEWWKKLTNLDTTKSNGYAFEGEFLPNDVGVKDLNLQEGDILIFYSDFGSIKYHEPKVVIGKITKFENKDVIIEEVAEVYGYDWAGKILSNTELVNKIKQLLNKSENEKEKKLQEIIKEIKEANLEKEIFEILKEQIEEEEKVKAKVEYLKNVKRELEHDLGIK